jgi:hypothetical protein
MELYDPFAESPCDHKSPTGSRPKKRVGIKKGLVFYAGKQGRS